jgi:hypothetical protein
VASVWRPSDRPAERDTSRTAARTPTNAGPACLGASRETLVMMGSGVRVPPSACSRSPMNRDHFGGRAATLGWLRGSTWRPVCPATRKHSHERSLECLIEHGDGHLGATMLIAQQTPRRRRPRDPPDRLDLVEESIERLARRAGQQRAEPAAHPARPQGRAPGRTPRRALRACLPRPATRCGRPCTRSAAGSGDHRDPRPRRLALDPSTAAALHR